MNLTEELETCGFLAVAVFWQIRGGVATGKELLSYLAASHSGIECMNLRLMGLKRRFKGACARTALHITWVSAPRHVALESQFDKSSRGPK
jgi:hypothetical protein